MKIGIEVQRLFRKQKFGIETSALQLIKKLQHRYPECNFVIYAKDDIDKQCLHHLSNLIVKTLTGKVFFDFEQLFLPLAAKHDKIDLLHCTGNTAPYFSPVPVVQTLHDVIFMDPISGKDSLYQQFGNYYRRMWVPLITPKSEAVITVSEYEKQRILDRLKIDEKKIRVIYNGIDEERFRVNDNPSRLQDIKRLYNLPQKFILFLGNTSARKNSLKVIEAYTRYASKIDNAIPIVTPGLPEKFIISHLESINQRDKLKYFISPGYVHDHDLATLYSLSTLFLYPSLSEGFGMPLVEAMACGTPVITSNISCLPEIAGDAAVLVDPTSADAIAEAITRLLQNQSLRLTKIADGLANAKRFSWDKTADQVFEVYEKVHFQTKAIREPSARMAYGIR
jgi:glycosyltransferase involved in cell wall biosynthesis